MEAWAQQYGMQKANGVEFYSEDGSDYQLMTQAFIAAGDSILFVPTDIILSSNTHKMNEEFGESLQEAEVALVNIDREAASRLPLFRLMVKILSEYDKGQDSPFYPWLNSLPREFYNGVSMTDACFDCLPPYASNLAMKELDTYSSFVSALRQGFVPISHNTINDEGVVKWAYNVALTRFHEVWEPTRQKMIAPMADMLNHAAAPNCEISFENDNCVVKALWDIQPQTTLTISNGSPTNPTPLFAQFGFLPNDCTTIFCKAVHLEDQIKELGYSYNDLLFETESGVPSSKVWDIFLYELLQKNDQSVAEEFFVACKITDGQKQQYHDHYFQYTLDAMKQHVYGILGDVDELTTKAQSYDLATHPRVPVIVAHNNLVRDTFTMTANLLESMG
eukprot:CAMPEP_0172325930 /NCGR_PEP_ID=MMETSP1058-20130122/55079_1 /TAXON_ID=83371 /ORGANISM="Detonula confervacea, Strain CCMP 353" /LENGTH=390 /DNA_ID=CAMNT_0013042573 /DNA_START=191 /DNA_END=1363 /DNA_ORIENTATION=-